MRESILVVDDESGVRASLAGILGDEGYSVQAVESGEDCLQALEGRRYDLLLLDVWLPRMDGLLTLSRVRTLDPEQIATQLRGKSGGEARSILQDTPGVAGPPRVDMEPAWAPRAFRVNVAVSAPK